MNSKRKFVWLFGVLFAGAVFCAILLAGFSCVRAAENEKILTDCSDAALLQPIGEEPDASVWFIGESDGNHYAQVHCPSWAIRRTSLSFSQPFEPEDSSYLRIRMYFHFASVSSFEDYGPDERIDLRIFGADATGSYLAFSRHFPRTQDQWVDITISGAALLSMADDSGTINGLIIETNFIAGTGTFYMNGAAYYRVDEVAAGSIEITAPVSPYLTQFSSNDYYITRPALESVDGRDCPNTANGTLYDWYSDTDYYQRIDSDGATDGSALRLNICAWRAGGLTLNFGGEKSLAEIKTLKLRMYFHLSQTSPYSGALLLYPIGGNGDEGTGYLFDADIPQDQWVDIELPQEAIEKLADEEGNIAGFQFAYWVRDTEVNYPNWQGYVLLDSVIAGTETQVVFQNGDASETQVHITGAPISKPVSPSAEGKVFAGWVKDGELYDFSSMLTEPLTLEASWLDSSASPVYPGLYSDGTDFISLFADGSFIYENKNFSGRFAVAAGDVMVLDGESRTALGDYANGVLNLDGKAFKPVSFVSVTYNDYAGSTLRYIPLGSKVPHYIPERPGYTFVGWELGGQAFDFEKSPLSDVVLDAVWTYDETADYSLYLGSYLSSDGNLLILSENNNAELWSGEEKTELRYYILSTGTLITVRGESESHSEIGDLSLWFEGREMERLRSYLVTFETGGGTEIERQRINEGTYRVSKPEDPTREGYRFAGWVDAEGNVFDFDTIVDESITLYAVWESTQENTSEGCSSSATGGELLLFGGVVFAAACMVRKKRGV